ncbi:hypothetical protein A3G56_02940 [Candidatus Falkowbacteria bacterium RIFCSPLOWO2_12_FULL_45_10]|uniref:Uncharacterized protein n=2 Tax=Candidatus Falkowiibacteriota TaxID=1752728 RepID=A0A1F5S0D4_9BACT|nr:MAG: hypothetical protein A3I35_02375 [Candidatus Falkowbacteria bacterium RIFCSPLOWO2_02_FULL_45_15]OGF19751.1 MAG: hypothetical protein A3G56_02940 [Candidatus Falkowbacteria bacterium RIFCSPLOWO2_12_FULL_45_10]
MYYKISRLLLTPTSGKPSTTADIFIANPQIDQEAILGKLFLLSEIESTKPAALKLLNWFISALPAHYYQNEKITLRDRMGTIKVSEIFEAALGKINGELENFIKKERLKIEPKAINIVAGVIYKNDLIFTATGKIKILLIYPEIAKESEILPDGGKKIYKISVIGDPEAGEKKPHLNKIFSNLTEGRIPAEGYVVLSNEILPEYVNNRHLTKIITTLPPVSAIEHLKSQLHKINSYVTFLALIIKSSATPAIKRSLPQMQINITANDSLERMNETENTTEKYLSPIGIIHANRLAAWGKNILAAIGGNREQKLTTIIRDRVFLVKKRRLNWLTRFNYHLKNFLVYALNVAVFLLKLLAHPQELIKQTGRAARRSSAAVKFSFAAAMRWFFNLSTASKTLLVTFLLCCLLFTVSIYQLTKNKNEQTSQQTYQELIQSLTQKQNQTEASLLYRNEDKAQELISETNVLIGRLREFKNVDQRLIDKFTDINAFQIATISHVVAIEEPAELINLKKLNAGAEPAKMVAVKERLIIADSRNKSLYQFNLTDQTVNLLKSGLNNIGWGTVGQADQALFVAAGGGIIIDDKNNITDINNFAALNEITEAVGYNGRLYLLSAPQNNIWRYSRDFSAREPWIKENLDINNAVSFDIDGYIYVLKNNGEIIRLLSGYANEFKLAAVNPPLANPQKIKLAGASEQGQIYVLEPAQTRLVVFDKGGKFLLQYKIPRLTNLRDFAVREQERKILLLNDAAVYEIKMEEIK